MALFQDIGLLDAAKESRELMEEEFRKDNELRSEMFIILKQEEVYWKQRARVTWLKEGDENISYLHFVANGRKNQNFIPWVWHEDQRVDDIGRMGDSFISYYKDLFGSAKEQHFQINWPNLLGPKAHNDLTMLDAPFTLDKIKVAVFGMKAEKDPRPDAFIKGRCIIDNIITAQELIFFMQKHRLPGLLLKVDFAKAFDTVDWKFLLDLLRARGFSSKWTGWIDSIFSSSKASFLINGIQYGGYDSFDTQSKFELDLYMEEKDLPSSGTFDILGLWKTNGFKYLILQKIAKDILVIPISIVAS
ncbi:uncharacterized protein LOC120259927 [Dioscorea cayenensis subsp. rotundata]|uniref:Uncharacterized protein LOC120259927 n=1 Tax=Dioscorea cayennensis subsp. rotundata TaxID=55577 RepID=A0AB40B9D5_DIOCR|nr:uncharacterized protein LOC120259927 [Dioscorea cayenensis subsp. rotundata]